MRKLKLDTKDTALINLTKLAVKEIYQFRLNEPFYTVSALKALGLSSRIPNLIKLESKTEGVKILNVGGMPTLSIKHKKGNENG